MSGGPPGSARPAGGGYEFTPEQDAKLSSTGAKLTFAGIMQIVWGVGQLLFSWFWGFGQWFYNLPISITLIVIGILFIGVGNSFKQISSTQGNDIDHLMSAVSKLGGLAIVQIIGFALAMVLGAAIVVLALFVGVAMLAAGG
ncbi:MAG: hypothetical protein H6718_22840 [Polyangiaceae bacterium]|nr:hypothetical protein [Polyangiaceae bacterium]